MRAKLRSTFFNLLGSYIDQPTPKPVVPTPEQLDLLKHAMLQVLGELGRLTYVRLERRIRYAIDAEGLWYLRSDLMQALSALQSEAVARKELRDLSALFVHYLPEPLMRSALSSRQG
jgi:hypothetical protein